MRTIDEIAAHYTATVDSDMLGFRGEVLLPYLPADKLKPFLKPEADMSDWKPKRRSETKALTEMRNYMEFAWEKVRDHRGISAGRSVEKMKAWLWLLEKDEVRDAVRVTAYAQYGAPQLRMICEQMGFHMPEGEDIDRMSRGYPCHEDCSEGCSPR